MLRRPGTPRDVKSGRLRPPFSLRRAGPRQLFSPFFRLRRAYRAERIRSPPALEALPMRLVMTTVAALVLLGIAASVHAETRAVPESRPQVQLSFAHVVKQVAPAVVNVYGARVDKR